MYNSRIDKDRMETLLPALKNTGRRREKEKQEPDFFLSDLLSVNPIVDKRNSKYKNNTNRIRQTKSGMQFENIKQEQHYRLNRDNKLKQNKQYADYLQQNTRENSKTSIKSNNRKIIAQTPSEHRNLKFIYELQDTDKQINEANLQLEEISAFIEQKKRQIMKGGKSKTNSELTVNQQKQKVNKKKSLPNTSENTVPHKFKIKSHKNGEKIKDINTVMKYIDEQTSIKNRKEAKQMKKLDTTLGMVNSKLNKVKEKYFTNEFEEPRINSFINKKPKYKSVRELLKMSDVRQSTMEASKLFQSQLEEDICRLAEAKDYAPSNPQMEVLYRSVDGIQNDSFQDNFSDEYVFEPKRKEEKTVKYQPSECFKEGATKFINVRTKAPTPMQAVDDKLMDAINKTMEADTQTVVPKTLKSSIMKSDYLRKEFGVDSDYGLPVESPQKKPGGKTQPKKWTRDLEYFMT